MNTPLAAGNMNARWSPEDHATAVRLRAEGKTYAQIGSVLGRSFMSVNKRLNKICKLSKPKPKFRPCLCCTKTFLSEGPHNRLCPDCRKKDVSPYAA